MWYLDNELILIILISLGYIFTSFVSKKAADFFRKYLLPFIFIGFLIRYNVYTCLFYLGITLINVLIAQAILKIDRGNKQVFVISIVLNILLYLFINIYPYLNSDTLSFVSFIGFSYSFLKYIDLIYYAYFYEEDISILDALNFMLFIPTFTSGPILIFNDFKKDIHKNQDAVLEIEYPLKRIIIGFFKKVIIVKILYILHDTILIRDLNIFLSFSLLFLFYLIGYLDFSGYSDIAIGFSRLMGFHAPENFNKPFLSPSLTVFWKNWHISLGSWVKGHISVFIKPKNRFYGGLSSFIIMVFIGVWHRFSILFLFWGIWHGIFLFMEGAFNLAIVNKKKTKPVVYFLRCVLTNLIVIFGCLFFYTDLDVVFKILKGFLKF